MVSKKWLSGATPFFAFVSIISVKDCSTVLDDEEIDIKLKGEENK